MIVKYTDQCKEREDVYLTLRRVADFMEAGVFDIPLAGGDVRHQDDTQPDGQRHRARRRITDWTTAGESQVEQR